MKKAFLSFVILFGFTVLHAQTDSLQKYTGKYKFPDGSPVSEITVTVDNGLLMAGSVMGSTELKPTSTADAFEVVAYSGTAIFKRKDGKVISLQILVGDINMEGTKTDGLNFSFSAPSPVLLRRESTLNK